VFVTGSSYGGGGSRDYATVAYGASSGQKLWAARYNGPVKAEDNAYGVATSPDSSKVFVAGASRGAGTRLDYTMVAYAASSGLKLWVNRYNGPANNNDYAFALGVGPTGSKVFATGASYGGPTDFDYATEAIKASTGKRIWVKRYNGPGNGEDVADSLAVSPDASKVFITGRSTGGTSSFDYATIAYSA
jgi:hypothetical protein